MRVVVLAPDLLDRSRISAVIPDAEVVDAAAGLTAAAVGADLVVVDLTRAGVVESLPALVAAAADVVGFGPHVEVDLLAAASAAGARALPRSRFFADVAAACGSVHG